MGHTTRCIPLIQYFKTEGHDVYAAAEAGSARLLQENFPELTILPLKGYRIHYSRNKATFSVKILLQIPKILSAIRAEHKWLMQIQKEYHFDLIIADNRYGMYHAGTPSVILTHQLQIQSGIASWMDNGLRKLHYRLLHRFDACWIVDEPRGYSGALAHPARLPANAAYVGILSQFSNKTIDFGKATTNQVLILLSGPEPMRAILEAKLLRQAKELSHYNFIIAGGNPLGMDITGLPSHLRYYTHLNATQLLTALETASLVVCRSGYSTIMDLILLQKKAVLIPTPGQSEQEYLAKYLTQDGIFLSIDESHFDLKLAIGEALAQASLPRPSLPFMENMKAVVAPFLKGLLK